MNYLVLFSLVRSGTIEVLLVAGGGAGGGITAVNAAGGNGGGGTAPNTRIDGVAGTDGRGGG